MWTITLTEQLRYYLNDADSVTYSDARLSKFIAFAALELVGRFGLTSNYSVNITTPSITPDPEDDPSFASLLVLKAAEIVLRNEIKQLAITAGYKVTDDRSSIDGANALKAYKDLLDMYSDNCDKAESAYAMGNGGIGIAILSPYTQGG